MLMQLCYSTLCYVMYVITKALSLVLTVTFEYIKTFRVVNLQYLNNFHYTNSILL